MQALDAAAVTAWADTCVDAVQRLRDDVDRINVYPVPDSDTGSNLWHTVSQAAAELRAADPRGAGDALATLAKAAVTAARGNSGVIASQMLRGMAESVGGADAVGATELADALARATDRATEAVARPVDGTMLTVLCAASDAAHNTCATGASAAGASAAGDLAAGGSATGAPAAGAPAAGDLAAVASAAATAAADALAATPTQLRELADAGVVDAGGLGLLTLLDALVATVTGAPTVDRRSLAGDAAPSPATRPPSSFQPWEVMYLLDELTDATVVDLREALGGLGDCVTVAGDGSGTHAVHVHCADIGAALEAGLAAGRPRQVRVEPLRYPTPAAHAVLAVGTGVAVAALIRNEGVHVLADQEPTRHAVRHAVDEVHAAQVTVLAATSELTAIAESVAADSSGEHRDVVVVPCASVVQVLAAIAVHDDSRRAADDVVAMAEAAAATRRGELVTTAEDALTWIGRANAGDLVGMIDDEAVLIEQQHSGRTTADVAMEVAERMLSTGGELVTVITGAQAPDGIGSDVERRIAERHPEVDVAVYQGDQRGAVLTFGVE